MNIFFILCQFSLLWLVIKKLLSLSTCSSSTSPSLTSLSTYSSASLSTSLSTITPIIITKLSTLSLSIPLFTSMSASIITSSNVAKMVVRWRVEHASYFQSGMSSDDSSGVTLAFVDPSLLSSWEGMVKLSVECSLLLKHGKGKIIATTPSPCSTLSSSTTSPSSAEKRKKEEEGEQGEKIEGSSCLSPTPGVGSWSSMLLPRQSHLLLQTRALVARKSWF